jgi:hypothetical protein
MIIAKKNEREIFFEKNIKLLPPPLQEILLKVDKKKLWEKVDVRYNEEGYPLCMYYDNGNVFKINSEKPLQEAKRWYDEIEEKGAGAIFLYGTGFGYPLFEVLSRKQSHTLVLVFEENIYLFSAMLHYFDLEPFIKNQRVVFLIGEERDFKKVLQEIFYSIILTMCTNPSLAFTHCAKRNFKDKYLKIHKYVFSQISLMVFYVGNDHKDNLTGFTNFMHNVKMVLENPYLSCLKGYFKDFPAFIVANGPSLDKNISQLKRIQDKGIIICAESSVIPLIKNNIKVDVMAVLERTKYTYEYHFKNVKHQEDMVLLALGVVDKNVFPSFSGAKIPVFRKKEAISSWLNGHIGDESSLDAGANVSHMAFELAVLFGANPIVFVGQDYSYGDKGVTHSKDSVYLEEKGERARKILESKRVIYVEGVYGEKVPSNQLWIDFKRGLEEKIELNPNKIVIDATEGGAKIKGTVCKKLSDVIDEYCSKKIEIKPYEIINESKKNILIYQRKNKLEKLKKDVKSHIQLFIKLKKRAVEGKFDCIEMIRICDNEEYLNHKITLEETYQKNIKAYQMFLEDEVSRYFCQQVLFVYYYLMNKLGIIDSKEKTKEIFKLQYDFFHHLGVVCQGVLVSFEDAARLLEGIDLKL